MEKLVSGPISSRCLDHMYHLQEKGTEFIFNHPKPNSMAVSTSSKSKKVHSTPNDREGKKLDSIDKRLYSTGSLRVRTSTYSGFMGRYQYSLCDQLGPILTLNFLRSFGPRPDRSKGRA